MKLGAWTAVVLLVCLVGEGQVLGGSSKKRGDLSVKFLSIASSSSMRTNLSTANTTISALSKTLSGLTTAGQTDELRSAADILTPLVQKSVMFSEKITGALSNLILDATVPIEVLFEQFDKVIQEISKYVEEEKTKIIDSIKESMGCVRAQQFTNLITVFDKLSETANIVSRIEPIVLNPDDLRHGRQSASKFNPSQLKNLVSALAENIKDLNDQLTALVTVIKNTVTGIEKSNSFLKGLISKETTTRSDLNTTGTQSNNTANTQLTNVKNKYEAAQLAMKTDLTNALKGLNIFSTSQMLNNFVEDNKKAYSNFYKFLKGRSESDLADMEEYYGKMGNRTAKTINETAEIFIDAVHRTGLRLADVVLEGGPHADSCYTTFSSKFLTPFTPLSTFVSSCVMKETTRWTSIATAVDDMLKLVQLNSQELSSNLGRCSSNYVNFATSSEDFVQAKACLKTNEEDLAEMPSILKPQLQNLNQVVKKETKASIFRIENCLTTNLHEAMRGLKFMRSAIEICAGPFDDCSRNNRDDDEKEWRKRKRDNDDE